MRFEDWLELGRSLREVSRSCLDLEVGLKRSHLRVERARSRLWPQSRSFLRRFLSQLRELSSRRLKWSRRSRNSRRPRHSRTHGWSGR